MKSAFLEVASHEFNTPITLVHGMSELLRLMNPDRDELERDLSPSSPTVPGGWPGWSPTR